MCRAGSGGPECCDSTWQDADLLVRSSTALMWWLRPGPTLPIRVPADEIEKHLSQGKSDLVLLSWVKSHYGHHDSAVFADPASFGFSSVTLLLDGLDEAHSAARVVLEWVFQWSAGTARHVVITTRPSALDGAVQAWFERNQYRSMELLPFDKDARDDLVRLRMTRREAARVLAAVGDDVDGSPWLWSLRIFLCNSGEQFWTSEPQVSSLSATKFQQVAPYNIEIHGDAFSFTTFLWVFPLHRNSCLLFDLLN